MKRIAIIPARGGSKRIPKKNIKHFLGKPIIAYTIEAALSSDLFEEVIVSTDDDVIADIAISYGATVPFKRSPKNSDDFATTYDVIEEVVKFYKETKGVTFEYGCCIYPTAPFTTKEKIKYFFDHMIEGNFDCVFPILRYGYPIQRALKMDKKGKINMIHPEHLITRSQDLEDSFHDAGQFYCFSIDKLLSEKKLWTDNTSGIVIDEMSAQDIDNLEDWEIAEFKFQIQNTKK